MTGRCALRLFRASFREWWPAENLSVLNALTIDMTDVRRMSGSAAMPLLGCPGRYANPAG